jgi:hypothetical protein
MFLRAEGGRAGGPVGLRASVFRASCGALIAAGLTGMMILLFLGSWRSL